ncbi:MAG TPA: hypothetical protein VHA52_10750, partial [Candidatus Babeliaceae bacterium]|nr:hypothetical protein [Candidatus Babeliaceae bacterium]
MFLRQYTLCSFTIFLITLSPLLAKPHPFSNSQDAILDQPVEGITIHPYGFIKFDTFLDTRQGQDVHQDKAVAVTVDFPDTYKPDRFCRDINQHPRFIMTALRTQIGCLVKFPNLREDVKPLGIIEFDNLTMSNNLPFIRMRLAYVTFNNPNWMLLIGRFYHPLCLDILGSNTVSANDGVRILALARDPQVRLVGKLGPIEIITAALSQQEFASPGPDGPTPRYLRNAIVPNLHLQVRYRSEKFICGAAIDFKRLVPRLATHKCIKVSESIDSLIGFAYLKIFGESSYISLQAYLAQNASDQTKISGYAVKTVDPETDFRTYANTHDFSIATDMACRIREWIEPGLFAGYSKNLGSREPLYIRPKD